MILIQSSSKIKGSVSFKTVSLLYGPLILKYDIFIYLQKKRQVYIIILMK